VRWQCWAAFRTSGPPEGALLLASWQTQGKCNYIKAKQLGLVPERLGAWRLEGMSMSVFSRKRRVWWVRRGIAMRVLFQAGFALLGSIKMMPLLQR
jgi:hypothetical protein